MTDAAPDLSSTPQRPVVPTAVTAATLYTDQAWVIRTGKLSLTGGERGILITDLPSLLEPDSIRVKGNGTTPVKILGIQTERLYNPKPVVEQVAQLTRQIDTLEQQKHLLEAGLTALDLQRSFVQGLLERSVDRFSRGLADQRIGLEQTRDLLAFSGEQYQECANAILQRQQERKLIEEQIKALRQQLHHWVTPRNQQLYQVRIDLAPSSSGEFKVEVGYSIPQASWTPLYDLRVNLKARLVNLHYLASVRQRTGEIWQDVRLSLSTAQPGLGSLPPQLDPWYLDEISPPPVPAALGEADRSQRQRSMALAAASEPPESMAADSIAATPTQAGGVIHFDLTHPNTVPSDGQTHKVAIFDTDLPCELDYLIVPQQVTFAYLQATITNPTEGVSLLPGQAQIFRDDTYVGSTAIEPVAPGQIFQVALGIDEGIKVERDLVERVVDKKQLRNQRKITFSYRIRVTQLRDHTAQIKVREQLPVSRHERIKVKLIKTEPQITPGEMGLLEWNFSLPINVKQTILYQFTVEHPPEMQVGGLSI